MFNAQIEYTDGFHCFCKVAYKPHNTMVVNRKLWELGERAKKTGIWAENDVKIVIVSTQIRLNILAIKYGVFVRRKFALAFLLMSCSGCDNIQAKKYMESVSQ